MVFFRSRSGQTIVEVIIAAGIIALVLTAVVAAVTASVKNTSLARSKALASKYSEQGMEFFRNQRATLGWQGFTGYFQGAGTTFCMPSIPGIISQLIAGTCAAGQAVDPQGLFTRQAQIVLTTSNGNVTNVQVTITVSWVDGTVPKTSTITQNFQQWSLKDATVPTVLAGTNIAVNKAATQWATWTNNPCGVASKAVDGNTDGNWADCSVALTDTEQGSWWQVDLGASYYISSINVWGRTDCCTQESSNFYILVSDQPYTSNILATTLTQSGVSGYAVPGTAAPEVIQSVNRTGRYIRIQLNQNYYLGLAEVQVITGTPP